VTRVESELPPTRILARPEHTLSRQKISTEALKVLYRLRRSGYLAYLVGGGVRDLLLGQTPKDFDIGTNARPQEVRRLFRNSRIIGRRFRLVHVFFRNEIVEVATFRASPEAPEGPDDWEEAEQEAMEEDAHDGPTPPPPEDDSYGTPAEDARRRDFTINALFYNIADFSVLDYVGGLDDLEAGLIRTIGDPDTRFQEDPVRMMRALEYSVRLGFEVDEASRVSIESCRHLILEASPARLSYELLEGLRSGSGAGICSAWQRSGILQLAFPELDLDAVTASKVLPVVDRGIGRAISYPDASLIGALFLARYYDLLRSIAGDSQRLDNTELLGRLRDMVEPAAAAMHLSNHTVHLLHQGLFTLSKMRRPPERGRQVLKLVRQDYFPVAWDLYSFAVEAGFLPRDVHTSWQRALARVRSGKLDDAAVDGGRAPAGTRRRRRPRSRRRR
jgi:poly(A) polymerase